MNRIICEILGHKMKEPITRRSYPDLKCLRCGHTEAQVRLASEPYVEDPLVARGERFQFVWGWLIFALIFPGIPLAAGFIFSWMAAGIILLLMFLFLAVPLMSEERLPPSDRR